MVDGGGHNAPITCVNGLYDGFRSATLTIDANAILRHVLLMTSRYRASRGIQTRKHRLFVNVQCVKLPQYLLFGLVRDVKSHLSLHWHVGI